MEYIQLLPMTIIIIAVALVLIAGFCGYFVSNDSMLTGVAIIVFSLLGGSMLIMFTVSNNINDVAQKLSKYYGIELTREDLFDLKYPDAAPGKDTYYGTTEISVGPEQDDLSVIKLMITSDNKIVLLENSSQNFVEMKPQHRTVEETEEK